MNISDLMDRDTLRDHIANGLVTARVHAETGLIAYKYTVLAQMERYWDEVTRHCRGLIADENDDIVGRGFKKFFNYSEHDPDTIDADAPGIIMDKLDGSLGIAFKHEGAWIVSTQGSLESPQAIHATAVMNDRYADTPYTEGVSLLFEIIYPDNRIVTDYGDTDDLFLLAGADVEGNWIDPDTIEWSGPRVTKKQGTIREALSIPDNNDTTEGFVVRLDSGLMMKMKFPSYLDLHRAKFGMTRKSILKTLEDGSFQEYLLILPDEFHDDAKNIAAEFMGQKNAIIREVRDLAASVLEGDRKAQAVWVKENVPKNRRGFVMGVLFYDTYDLDGNVLTFMRRNHKES